MIIAYIQILQFSFKNKCKLALEMTVTLYFWKTDNSTHSWKLSKDINNCFLLDNLTLSLGIHSVDNKGSKIIRVKSYYNSCQLRFQLLLQNSAEVTSLKSSPRSKLTLRLPLNLIYYCSSSYHTELKYIVIMYTSVSPLFPEGKGSLIHHCVPMIVGTQ